MCCHVKGDCRLRPLNKTFLCHLLHHLRKHLIDGRGGAVDNDGVLRGYQGRDFAGGITRISLLDVREKARETNTFTL